MTAGAALHTRLWGLVRLRCPLCYQGRMFTGPITMNAQCPVCRYVFEREPGYFLGAIAIGYFMGVGCVSVLAVLVRLVAPHLDWEWCFTAALVLYLGFTPLVFRYARAVWMYADNWLDPPAS